jgi:hypothetical protein
MSRGLSRPRKNLLDFSCGSVIVNSLEKTQLNWKDKMITQRLLNPTRNTPGILLPLVRTRSQAGLSFSGLRDFFYLEELCFYRKQK